MPSLDPSYPTTVPAQGNSAASLMRVLDAIIARGAPSDETIANTRARAAEQNQGGIGRSVDLDPGLPQTLQPAMPNRSEEHKSERQSLMRNSYAVLCWKKKKKK